ncbi:MAG: branched-chain amino acid aminotransferase [Myxococcales bacterium]|nr:branched-chain amino acid aminotransferase [Myxococcales bacterium]
MGFEIVRTQSPRPRPAQDALGFGRHFSDHMFRMEYGPDPAKGWYAGRIVPYGPLTLEPAASVLHYGQTIFEGLKAFRGADGSIALFRPQMHAARFVQSADRLCIPRIPEELFVDACRELVALDHEWVPGADGASLYLRPLVLATEPFLGVRPSLAYTFLVITSPVGAYYASGFAPVRIKVERQMVRAARGGVGASKTAANYAASLAAAERAKAEGFAQVLWTDAAEHRYVEEVGTMNVFFQIGEEVITPELDGVILPGVTRASVIELLRHRGVPVVERKLALQEILEAHADGRLREAFGSGTAAVVSPISALGVDGELLTVGNGGVGPLAGSLFEEIIAIQHGTAPDLFGWLVPVPSR